MTIRPNSLLSIPMYLFCMHIRWEDPKGECLPVSSFSGYRFEV